MSDLIEVTLTPIRLQAAPDEEIAASIEIQNLGRVVDAYTVEIQGLPAGWFGLQSSSVSLFPGDAEPVALAIHIPAGSEALAGSYEFTVRVSSSVYPGEETIVLQTLQVEEAAGYDARVRPELVAAPSGAYSIAVTNTGNTDITLDLDGTDPEGLCRCSFNPNPLTVAPGETGECAALVRPRRRPLVEPPRRYDLTFNLAARPPNERTSLSVRLEASPYARKWYFPVALLLLALLAWFSYSAYWFALERNDLTYLRGEKWDDFSEPSEVRHGHIELFEFELGSTQSGSLPLPPPVAIRGNITWPEASDTAPTVGVVVRSPEGHCWGPQIVDRTGEPFHFPVHDGGTPCHSLEYGWLLMDVSTPRVPIPAEYVTGAPLIEYCVRDVDQNPIVKFFQDGDFQTPYRLSADYTGQQVASPSQSPDRDQEWAIYVVNPHPPGQWPAPPELTVNLKAVGQEPHSWKKDRTYSVDRLELPHPRTAIPRLQCGWDSETDIPRDEGGLEHGVIYVRRLEITERPAEDATGAQSLEDIGHYGCPMQRDDATETHLRTLCGDVTWERTTAESEALTADSVFIILRHSLEEEAQCWSRVERHSSPDSVGSPFTFDLLEGGQPCPLELADPEQTLWNLMNWSTFEPARFQGVQPLVKFCSQEGGQTLFGRHSAVPLPLEESWEQNRTPGWTFYILNPSSDAAPPRVTVKLKGDQFWKVDLQDLPNTTLGDTPLAPPGSEGCPGPTAN